MTPMQRAKRIVRTRGGDGQHVALNVKEIARLIDGARRLALTEAADLAASRSRALDAASRVAGAAGRESVASHRGEEARVAREIADGIRALSRSRR